MAGFDEQFYQRADAHIQLSNQQISPEVTQGKASASMMYATARFNAWVTATGFNSGQEMLAAKEKTLDYFTTEYRAMLDEHLQDYIQNFPQYMQK